MIGCTSWTVRRKADGCLLSWCSRFSTDSCKGLTSRWAIYPACHADLIACTHCCQTACTRCDTDAVRAATLLQQIGYSINQSCHTHSTAVKPMFSQAQHCAALRCHAACSSVLLRDMVDSAGVCLWTNRLRQDVHNGHCSLSEGGIWQGRGNRGHPSFHQVNLCHHAASKS